MVHKKPTSLIITFYFNLLEILAMEIIHLWHLNVKGQFFHMSGKIIVKNEIGKEEKKWQQSTFFVQVKKYIYVIAIQKKTKQMRHEKQDLYEFFSRA